MRLSYRMPSLRRVDEMIPRVDALRPVERVDEVEPVGRGEVWRARFTGGLAGEDGVRLPGELAGVGECRVRLLRMPVDEALRARAQTLAGDLMALDEPGLLAIRAVRKAYDGIALVYGQLPAAATGLHLVARRRLLLAGEVVTLGVALSWALAHAHAAGIVHGRLSDADVLIGADGRPVLTGVGVLGVLGAPTAPEADVLALERMLGSLLDRESEGAGRVAQVLAQGCSAAAELAARLASAAPAVPIRVDEDAVDSGSVQAQASARRRRRRPRWLRPRLVLAGVGVVLLGGLAGWASAPGPHARTARAAPAEPTPVSAGAADWRQVLTRLDTAWSRGFDQPDVGFADVDAPGSSALRYDTAAAAALRARGVHAAGLRLALDQVAVESVTASRASLRVEDRRSAYQLRNARGELVSSVPARGSAWHRIVLVASGTGSSRWRFASVVDLAKGVSS